MNVEQRVAEHYTRGSLEAKIMDALRSVGKNLDRLQAEDLAPLDNFHLGGREATEALASSMGLRPGGHLLDVGCGVGGPARYFASRGFRVTGIDLSEEFVRAAQGLSQLLHFEEMTTFRRASALALPFAGATFDGAYQIHVGMNIADKAGAFREAARVLTGGATFAVFDIVRVGSGELTFPVPWARTPETSFVATLDEYRSALEMAGFRVSGQHDRRNYAAEMAARMKRQGAAAMPVLGVHLLMGEEAPAMLKNVLAAVEAGILSPMEIIARRQLPE
ncbi:MAG: class I SAM-dependent methyltransferase [Acidobacteria bacterium]|nr:class I SAM-dependent methyltransferase [Acidobacteriota bacterium]